MTAASEPYVLGIIREALGDNAGIVTLDTKIGDVEAWDSLGHLSILAALDEKLDGKVADIDELATARSVREIVDILKIHRLM